MEVILKVENLRKSYDNMLVIDDWNLELKKGESLFLFGPSGCGKTTFLKIVAGILGNFRGKVERKTNKIGFVFQNPRLIPWLTVKENLEFVRKNRERIEEVIEITGLRGFENTFPSQLSGGLKQRVNLARALLIDPELLILDEPFNSLDVHIKYRLMNDILSIKNKYKSSLLGVTHNPEEASFMANRIIVLSKRPSKIIKVLNTSDIDNPEEELLKIALEIF